MPELLEVPSRHSKEHRLLAWLKKLPQTAAKYLITLLILQLLVPTVWQDFFSRYVRGPLWFAVEKQFMPDRVRERQDQLAAVHRDYEDLVGPMDDPGRWQAEVLQELSQQDITTLIINAGKLARPPYETGFIDDLHAASAFVESKKLKLAQSLEDKTAALRASAASALGGDPADPAKWRPELCGRGLALVDESRAKAFAAWTAKITAPRQSTADRITALHDCERQWEMLQVDVNGRIRQRSEALARRYAGVCFAQPGIVPDSPRFLAKLSKLNEPAQREVAQKLDTASNAYAALRNDVASGASTWGDAFASLNSMNSAVTEIENRLHE